MKENEMNKKLDIGTKVDVVTQLVECVSSVHFWTQNPLLVNKTTLKQIAG